MQQGVLCFDSQAGRLDILFETKGLFYGGLHCGTTMFL